MLSAAAPSAPLVRQVAARRLLVLGVVRAVVATTAASSDASVVVGVLLQAADLAGPEAVMWRASY